MGEGEKEGMPTFVFPSLSASTLGPFLTYLYTGRLPELEEGREVGGGKTGRCRTETLMELAVVADEFLLPGLVRECEWELCLSQDYIQGEGTEETGADAEVEAAARLFKLTNLLPGMSVLRVQSALRLVKGCKYVLKGGGEGGCQDGEDEGEVLLKEAIDCLMDK
jgi:hypothetical protein